MVGAGQPASSDRTPLFPDQLHSPACLGRVEPRIANSRLHCSTDLPRNSVFSYTFSDLFIYLTTITRLFLFFSFERLALGASDPTTNREASASNTRESELGAQRKEWYYWRFYLETSQNAWCKLLVLDIFCNGQSVAFPGLNLLNLLS